MRVRVTAGPAPTAQSVAPSGTTGTTAVNAVSAGIGRTEASGRSVMTVIVIGRTVTGAEAGAVTTARAATTAGGTTAAVTGTASLGGAATAEFPAAH